MERFGRLDERELLHVTVCRVIEVATLGGSISELLFEVERCGFFAA